MIKNFYYHKDNIYKSWAQWILRCLFVLLTGLAGCKKDEPKNNNTSNVDNNIFGSQFDPEKVSGTLSPFPLFDNPLYVKTPAVDFLDSADLVLCYKAGSSLYVYPIKGLHIEVLNDVVEEVPIAITYCPLTVSGIGWNRVLDNDTLLLTASGYLYCDNQMTYDLKSESIWSQMLLKHAKGKYSNKEINVLPLIETIWYNIEKNIPDANVFKPFKADSVHREIAQNFYNFPRSVNYETKSRVFGVLGVKGPILVPYTLFPDSVKIISSRNMIAVGSSNEHFMNVFMYKDGLRAVQGAFPVVMEDNTGTKWDIFGEAVSGPNKGEQLVRPKGYVALDNAWLNLFGWVEKF